LFLSELAGKPHVYCTSLLSDVSPVATISTSICEILGETDTKRKRRSSVCLCSTNQIVTEDSQIAG